MEVMEKDHETLESGDQDQQALPETKEDEAQNEKKENNASSEE